MGGRRKQRQALLFLLVVLVFIGTFAGLLPYLFQLPFIHEKTENFIARRIKGDFSFRKGSLAFFPRPCIRIRDVELKTGHGVSAAIEAVSAYPDLPSLLLGRLDIARATATRPKFILEISKTENPFPLPTHFKVLQERLENCIYAFIPETRSRFTIDIQHGAFALTQAEKQLLAIQEIAGRAEWKPPVISIEITGRSDFWDEGRLAFSIDAVSREGAGSLAAKRCSPKAVAGIVFPKSFPQVDSAVLDVAIDLKTRNFEAWDLSFEALNPDITFRKGKKTLVVRGNKAAVKLKKDKTSTRVSVTALDLSNPRLHLTGDFDLDTEKPHAGWQASARDVDLASTKAASLFFVGWSKIARRIFGVLPEGTIPQINLGQKAANLDGLQDVSSLFIRGRLHQATVQVPNPDLLLTDTSGEVNVSNGILEAFYVKTRLGNSTGSQGRFTMSLKKQKRMPFHVEADIQADVSALPPLLAKLVKERLFSDEMDRVTSAEGTAVGKMILDRGDGPLRVTVDVSDFALSAAYDRIPFPLSATGGGFHYRNGEVRVQDIQGRIGDSAFSDVSGEIFWPSSPVLTVSSARMNANVDEVVAWLTTSPAAGRIMQRLRPAKGRIFIDRFRFEGPVDTPADWQFQSEGHITEPLTFLIPLFPKPLIFHQGRFTIDRNTLDFSSGALSVFDARVSATGTFRNYAAKNRQLDARLEGRLGEESCRWIFERAPIPKMYRWQAPITVSPVTIDWVEHDGVAIAGQATAPNGSIVSFDISKASDALVVNNLAIQDVGSRADMTLAIDKDLMEISFSGDLNGSSLNALLLENKLLAGSVRGNFRTRYSFTNPLKSTLIGDFKVAGLDASAFGLPLKITEASLTADRTSAQISNARLTWKESDFSVSGRIAQIEKGLLLDLDLDSKRLNWSEVKTLLESTRNKVHAPPDFLFGKIRTTCGHFTLSPAITFQPLEVELELNGDRTDILFHRAEACGISFPGAIALTPNQTLFSFEPTATQQALEPTLDCLQNGGKLMDGLFDLNGKLAFQLNGASITESVKGEASLTAKDGRIYRAVLLGKIFSLLNIGDILSGDFPDLEKEGFPYKTSVFKGRFDQGRFELETGVIDSSGMKIFYEGKEDLVNRRHDLTVVVAPLRTVDSVVEKIPLVNSVLSKGAVIYPVRVTGSWDKPELSLLSPTAVGGEVWGIIVRALRLPVTLLESIFTDGKKE